MLEYDTDNDNLKTSRIRSYRYKKLGVLVTDREYYIIHLSIHISIT